MTQLQPPLPNSKSRRLGTMVAWGVIVASLVLLFGARWYAQRTAPMPAGRDDAAAELGLRLSARYAVGTRVLLSYLDKAEAPATQPVQELARQVEQAAVTPQQQLRIVPVIAELLAADAAIQYLEQITLPDDADELRKDAQVLRSIYTAGPQALDAAEQQRLIKRHGWFGRLAMSWQRSPDDPLRRAAIAPAVRTALLGIGGIAGAMVSIGTGAVLLIVAVVMWSKGRFRAAMPRPSDDGAVLIEAFALYLAWFVGIGLLATVARGSQRSLISFWTILTALAPLACLWPLVRGMRFDELRLALGWHPGRGVFREMAWGIIGYIAGLPLIVVAFVITFWLTRLTGARPMHPAIEMISTDFWQVFALLSLAAIYAPLAEETMFRGALYAGMRRRAGVVISALVASFIFAAIHPQGLVALPVLMTIAIISCLIREWRGSLIAPVVAHAINNGALLLFLILAAG